MTYEVHAYRLIQGTVFQSFGTPAVRGSGRQRTVSRSGFRCILQSQAGPTAIGFH